MSVNTSKALEKPIEGNFFKLFFRGPSLGEYMKNSRNMKRVSEPGKSFLERCFSFGVKLVLIQNTQQC